MNLIEISVDSLESALAAEQGGAHRVELCSALREGGLTPSLGLIRAVRSRLAIDVFILIRPRSGDFLYSNEELQIMQEDIRIASTEGAQGVVLGVLTPEGDVDVQRTAVLVQQAGPMQVTFHRAFDMTRDLLAAQEQVIRAGADRILTSGGMSSALQGSQHLRELAQAGGGRITLLAGGGVRPANIAELARTTGIAEFHSSMRHVKPSAMLYRNAHLHLGEAGLDEYATSTVLAEQVQELVSAAQTVSTT